MNKIFLIAIGVLAFAAVLGAVQFVSAATAHKDEVNHMSCMTGHTSLTEMDKNNDGVCDICGMPVSECAKMANNHDMKGTMSNMTGMSCHNQKGV